MKKFTICALSLTLLSSCLPLEKDLEAAYPNTQIAVESCVTKNASEIVEQPQIRDACASKHKIEFKVWERYFLNGKAGYSSSSFYTTDTSVFEGDLTNESVNLIFTNATIEIQHTENPDKTETLYLTGLWIPPSGKYNFSENVLFKPKSVANKDAEGNSLYTWNISSASGVRIELR
ncbi:MULTISPECIES: hypothetical protein [Thalassospira]|uniref:Lipoprotein n=1 Tax=Thalassospira xiamenensis TaxID=220697 RepID=A0ABR5Y311_9PROT|nr:MULTISPECIES: hypothetical protein [Thalassospira]OCK10215.1 hypothetical protein KO164_4397 [Thalassospira sp. KO164]SEE90649.1 hypothetical protein SAMN04515623_4462 [Thalassospira permensis]KZD04012.1 hypothetical protein AUP40_16465 [Thalassospira xiamenensis]MAB32183.1 hypothetical protein [Thalassospira sp.]MAL29704.1 hypothetical protein [Thalassospira sp.]